MPSIPGRFWWLLIPVSSAAAVVSGLALYSTRTSPWILLVFFAVAMAFEAAPARLHAQVSVSLAVVVQLTAIPFAGLPAAVCGAVGAGVFAGMSATSSRVVKVVLNIGMLVLAAAGGAMVFSVVTGSDLMTPDPAAILSAPGPLVLGLLAAAVAYSVTNTLLLAGTVHLTAGVPFRDTTVQLAKEIFLLQFVYVGLAAIAFTLLVKVHSLTLGLMIVPLLVARRSLLSVQNRQEAFDRMVGAFVETIQAKDGYTRGHAERVSELSVRVAERMGLSYEDRELIRYGAILHDVGKVGVSLGILCKAGPLTDDEFDEMKRHPDIGADILEDIDFLQPALAIVRHHHERMDGRGYPAGLASGEIPLLTRVVTAVDAFDAMTSTRSYRRALPVEVAIGELQNNAGTQFDAEVVEHVVAVIEQDGWTLTDEPVTVSAPISAARS